MAIKVDLKMAAAVKDAVTWAKYHPERDPLDAAYAAIMNAPRMGLGGQHDNVAHGERWAEFLAAVRESLNEV